MGKDRLALKDTNEMNFDSNLRFKFILNSYLSIVVLNGTTNSYVTRFRVEFKVSDANTGLCLVYRADEIDRSGSGPN